MQMKSHLSRLTLGMLIGLGAVAQASPSFAETFTRTYSTPKGPVTFDFDQTTNNLTYKLGDPNSTFYSEGGFNFDSTNSKGVSYGKYIDGDSVGTFSQESPISSFSSGFDYSSFTSSGQIPFLSLLGGSDPNFQGAGGAGYQPTGSVTRPFSTPQGPGVYTYDLDTGKVVYNIGDPNSSFFYSGESQFSQTTGEGYSSGTYIENGSKGTFTQRFGSKDQELTIPDSIKQVTEALSSSPDATTSKFSTPKGDVNFTSDFKTGNISYYIGDPKDPFYYQGVFQLDQQNSVGKSYGVYKDNGNVGTSSQEFKISIPAGTDFSSPQQLPFLAGGSPFQAGGFGFGSFGGQGGAVPEVVSGKYPTPQGEMNYTFNLATNELAYQVGDPNGSFYFEGGFKPATDTSAGFSYGSYNDNGTKGTFTQTIGGTKLKSVPEPGSPVGNTLGIAVVLGAGLMLKTQNRRRKEAMFALKKV